MNLTILQAFYGNDMFNTLHEILALPQSIGVFY